MITESHESDSSRLDDALSKQLARTYGNLTRRSFFSMATRKVLKLAGIAVASEVLPYLATDARADVECGLHGYVCNPQTTCNGGTQGISWVQCCFNHACLPGSPGFDHWQCCAYTDYCGTRPANWGNGCSGPTPSGTAWCGEAPGQYICTTLQCMYSLSSQAACEQQCVGPVCGT
jgi:hypothetical protein